MKVVLIVTLGVLSIVGSAHAQNARRCSDFLWELTNDPCIATTAEEAARVAAARAYNEEAQRVRQLSYEEYRQYLKDHHYCDDMPGLAACQ